MSKKPSLLAAVHAANGKSAAAASPEAPASNDKPPPTKVWQRPARIGKKAITGHFDPAAVRQLKQLALDHDTSVQDLLREALNDLFEKRNLKPIA